MKVTDAGLFCEPGGFHVDPHRAVERAVITHGHADHARPGHTAVLATPATFQSELFASVVARFAPSTHVIEQVCPGWVELVEAGEVSGPHAERTVASSLRPILTASADVLVLACTHYPFLRPVIERVAGPDVTVVDPADAVARQVARLRRDVGSGATTIELTGPDEGAAGLVERITGLALPTRAVTLAA